MVVFSWFSYMRKMKFDYHCLLILVEYHRVLNLASKGSNGSVSGKVAPYGISHAMKVISMTSQLK
jgi:hypothetical protein